MNRAKLQQQRDWIQQRVNSGGRSFSPWDAMELLDALLGESAGVMCERRRDLFTQDGRARIDPLANWSA